MAVAVERAPRRQERPRARTRPRRKAAPARRVAGGAVWIVVLGFLLAGVVALNVAVLRLNLRSDELTRESVQLRADSAELASKLAAGSASARTSSRARRELGLQPADPSTTTYLQLGRGPDRR
jgi:hypothetical protein